MSLYDDAKFFFSGEAAAGANGKAFSVKPEEKLKATELLTDPSDFSSGGSWNPSNSITVSNSVATFNGTGYMAIYQDNIFEEGKVYKISLTATIRKGEGIDVGSGENSQDITGSNTPITTSGSHSFYYTGQGGTNDHRILLKPHDHDTAYDFDVSNVSVKEVEEKARDFKVTRSSDLTATRVRAASETTPGLIEKGHTNLLKYSNSLTTTWTKNNATIAQSSDYGGQIIESKNFKLTATSSSLLAHLDQTIDDFQGLMTLSVYAKAGDNDGTNFIRLGLEETLSDGTTAVNSRSYFDLRDASNTQGALYGNAVSSDIVNVGHSTSGWRRCSVTFNIPAANVVNSVRLYLADSLSTQTPTENHNVYLQHFQLERGLAPSPTIITFGSSVSAGLLANEPRYDYRHDTDGCPGLLVEPARTNRFPKSEYFGDWSTEIQVNEVAQTSATILTNNAVSPEGLKNATKLQEDGDTTNHKMSAPLGDSFTQGDFYSFSIFAKADGRNKFRFTAGDKAKINYDATFTLTGSGSVTNAGSGTARIEDYGNGWYRCIIENLESLTGVATKQNIFLIHDTDGQNYDGDGTSGVLFYGDQVEAGSFCTSYIPAHGDVAAATRAKDVIHTGPRAEIVRDHFTLFIHLDKYKNAANGLWRVQHNDSNRSIFQYNTSIGYTAYIDGRAYEQSRYGGPVNADTDTKLAVVFNGDSVVIYINGTVNRTDHRVYEGMDGFDKVEFNYGDGSAIYKSLMIFDRALTEDEAKSLTTI